MKKDNWLTRIRKGAINRGVIVEGVVHKASPMMEGNVILSDTCHKCGSNNGVVFRSHMDKKVFILFCQKCGKYSWGFKGKKKDLPTGEKRCKAMTARKNRCANKATHDNGLCGTHEAMRSDSGNVLSVEGKIIY